MAKINNIKDIRKFKNRNCSNFFHTYNNNEEETCSIILAFIQKFKPISYGVFMYDFSILLEDDEKEYSLTLKFSNPDLQSFFYSEIERINKLEKRNKKIESLFNN